VFHYDPFLCYVSLCFITCNKTLKVCYDLPSYKKRVKQNRRENKWHLLDDIWSAGNTKFYNFFSLTSKIQKRMENPCVIRVFSLCNAKEKSHKNINSKKCKQTVKWFSTNLLHSYRRNISNNSTVSLSVHNINYCTGSLTLNNLPSNIINNFTITQNTINVFVTILPLALRNTIFCQNISNNFTTCVTEQSLVTILVTILPAALRNGQQSY
jgi:hypothetical protein